MDSEVFALLTPQQQLLIRLLVSDLASTRTTVTNNANAGLAAYAPAYGMLPPPLPGQQLFAGPPSTLQRVPAGPSLVPYHTAFHASAAMPNGANINGPIENDFAVHQFKPKTEPPATTLQAPKAPKEVKPKTQPPATTLHAPKAPKVEDPDEDANRRHRIYRGIGVAPHDRTAVAARRQEVTKYLLTAHGIRLDRAYTRWSTKTWIEYVDKAWKEFAKRYGWTWYATEALLKVMSEDNVRNAIRKRARIVAARGAANQAAPGPTMGSMQSFAVQGDMKGDMNYIGHANGFQHHRAVYGV